MEKLNTLPLPINIRFVFHLGPAYGEVLHEDKPLSVYLAAGEDGKSSIA